MLILSSQTILSQHLFETEDTQLYDEKNQFSYNIGTDKETRQ